MANLHIYRVDDYSWYVAHNMDEFIAWYNKYIDSLDDEQIEAIEEMNPEDGYMLNSEGVTEEDLMELGDSDEICNLDGSVHLCRRMGTVYKRQTFAEVLGDEDPREPYEIASIEF